MRFLSVFVATMLAVVAASAQTVEPSPVQLRFGQAVEQYSNRYQSAENELKASAIVAERREALNKIIQSGKFDKWLFKIEKFGTTGDGHAFVVFANDGWPFKLKTWNNALSDSSDKTLIRHGSPLYTKLADMKEGQLVFISGQMVGVSGLTERGKMVDPEFVARFSAIEAWAPAK